MNKFKLALTALALSVSFAGNAVAEDDPLLQAVQETREGKLSNFFSVTQNAEWVASLPETSGMIITKLKNGEYMIVDANLRYAFYATKIVNIVNGDEVTGPQKANDVWLVNAEAVAKLPLPLFRYGPEKPKADITIMTAMTDDEPTRNTVEFIKKLMDEYRIDVIMMGTRNNVEAESAAHLMCAEDRLEAKQRLLDMKFPVKQDKLTHLKQHATCKGQEVLSTITLARMYNVKAYPFVYNAYGASVQGLPNDIEDFMVYQPNNLANIQGLDWSNK